MEDGIGSLAGSKGIAKLFSKAYTWLIFILFGVTVVIFALIHMRGLQTGQLNYTFSLLLGVIPFLASFRGFTAAKRWGGFRSALGRSVFCLSLGLFFWSVGELIWSYYNLVLQVEAPYPSTADIGFALGVTFWIISTLLLSKVTAVGLFLRRLPLLWIVVGLFILAATALSYYLLVEVARQGVLLSDATDRIKVFFDLYYPFADLVSLMMVGVIVLVSGRFLGGKLRPPFIFSLAGLCVMYVGDVIFSYTTTVGSFYNASWGDLVLLIGISLLSLSLITYDRMAPLLEAKSKVKSTG